MNSLVDDLAKKRRTTLTEVADRWHWSKQLDQILKNLETSGRIKHLPLLWTSWVKFYLDLLVICQVDLNDTLVYNKAADLKIIRERLTEMQGRFKEDPMKFITISVGLLKHTNLPEEIF